MEVALHELSIELTNKCLLRCIHCSSGSQPAVKPDELSREEHFRLVKEARDLGATVLSLSGGDPILCDHSVGLVAYAKASGYERILFYTTGIHDADMEYLDMAGVDPYGALWGIDTWPHLDDLVEAGGKGLSFIFSLHSHRPEVHDYIMGTTGAWYTTTGSIDYLNDRRNASNYLTYGIEVHMVPMLPNHRHISGVRDLCETFGVDRMSLLRFVPQTRGHSNRDVLSLNVKEFIWLQQKLHYELTTRADHPVAMRPGCPIDFRHAIGLTESKSKPCHAGYDLILIRPDGSVHPCAAWKTLPDDSNVREAPLADIWENAHVFQALREFGDGGYRTWPAFTDRQLDAPPCAACGFVDSCKGGCPAQKLHAYGKDITSLYDRRPDPLCPKGLE